MRGGQNLRPKSAPSIARIKLSCSQFKKKIIGHSTSLVFFWHEIHAASFISIFVSVCFPNRIYYDTIFKGPHQQSPPPYYLQFYQLVHRNATIKLPAKLKHMWKTSLAVVDCPPIVNSLANALLDTMQKWAKRERKYFANEKRTLFIISGLVAKKHGHVTLPLACDVLLSLPFCFTLFSTAPFISLNASHF